MITVNVDLEWRADGFGEPLQALYLGDLYVGAILHIRSGERSQAPWRAWFMSDDEGNSIGWFTDPDDARKAVVTALIAALGGLIE